MRWNLATKALVSLAIFIPSAIIMQLIKEFVGTGQFIFSVIPVMLLLHIWRKEDKSGAMVEDASQSDG